MGDVIDIGSGVVERYLACMVGHDWDGAASCRRSRAAP